MSRFIYINGQYKPYKLGVIHVEDRAVLFGDAVYEVCQILDGQIIDPNRHLKRLERSLSEIHLKCPISLANITFIMKRVAQLNRVTNGMVYLQITRGNARRDFAFPSNETAASIICFARSASKEKLKKKSRKGIKVITVPDMRWKRVDIKTTNLLPSCLARQSALEQGADEAWLVNEKGQITEGAACNAWILDQNDMLWTHPANGDILKGITRDVLFETCRSLNIKIHEKYFTVSQAEKAKEAFITAATNIVTPVTRINKAIINQGKVGLITNQLQNHFRNFTQKENISIY